MNANERAILELSLLFGEEYKVDIIDIARKNVVYIFT